jgi:hypothetical protein
MKLVVLLLAALGLLGCAPRTYEDCKFEAAKNPSERGVAVALKVCYEKFEAPRLRAEEDAAMERMKRIASNWPRVRQVEQTIDDVKKLIGDPDSSEPAACVPIAGLQSPSKCTVHRWRDTRVTCSGRMESCSWQLQSAPDGRIWATWDEPF